MSLIPALVIDEESLTANFSIYQDDVPSFSALTSEIDQWMVYCRHKVASGEVTLPDNLINCLPYADKDAFPNIRVLIEIGCIFPVASAEAERSFSVLRRLKTSIRNSMREDRNASLSIMHMNYDIPIDENEIVERFVRKNPHRFFRSLRVH